MSALAAYLRDRLNEDIRRLTPDERIRLAMSLGDDDLDVFCAATGQAPDRARARLRATRQAGRRPSAAAGSPVP